MIERCEECGSWGSECGSPVPVKNCGCARCANLTIGALRKDLAEAVELLGKLMAIGVRPEADIPWDQGSAQERVEVRRRVRAMLMKANDQKLGPKQIP